MMPSRTNIAILGAGAIGQLICWQLTQAGAAVAIMQRVASGQRNTINVENTVALSNTAEHGVKLNPLREPSELNRIKLSFSDLSGQTSHYTVPHLSPAQIGQIELLIVCVKAYQVVEALTPLIPTLSKNCQILLLHNGMGPHLTIAKQLDGQGLILGTTSQGAIKLSQWHVRHTGMGLSQLGQYQGERLAKAYQQLLLNALPNSEWLEDILPALWQKLAVNAAINPLTAIHQCQNGALKAAQFKQTIAQVIDELQAIAVKEGITLDKSALVARVEQVIELTALNYSSMYQDIAHKRASEIDSINGYLVERAMKHQLNAPINNQLLLQVKALEKQNQH